jgi:hypothetical protein
MNEARRVFHSIAQNRKNYSSWEGNLIATEQQLFPNRF